MNARHVELLRRLEQFQLDSPEAALPFSARLARENNWTTGRTQTVIAEYKRFAFLAVAAGHPVSPSEDVDQAWHLHLTYSESYWKVFCPEVLGQPLHHQPTRGGETERDKFDDWYARTLESYEKFFGEPPPADIWPSPEARRMERHDFVRVDRARNWVLPKPHRVWSAVRALRPGLVLLALLGGGAMLPVGANVFDWRGPDFLAFYIIFFAVVFALALWLRRSFRVPVNGQLSNLPELDGYATAYLNGGKVLAVNTAIASLVNQKAMRVDAKRGRITSLVPEPAFTHELERRVYAAARSTDGATIADVRFAAKSAVTQVAGKLEAWGLVVADAPALKALALPLMLTLAAVAVGVVKIGVGVTRGRPVGFLVALCLISLVVSLIALARRPRRSRYGDAVLKRLQAGHTGPRRLGRDMASIPAAEFATVVGLFGMTALAGTDLADLPRALQPPAGNGSGCGSSCGSGCGGGGCGGGCGGCGGG